MKKEEEQGVRISCVEFAIRILQGNPKYFGKDVWNEPFDINASAVIDEAEKIYKWIVNA